jgi:mannan endo-1,4-beta-mannosidase
MRAHRALILAGLLAILVATPVPAPALQGIVRAQGDGFVLDGQPFRFVGTNAFYMALMTALGSPAHADDQLALAQALGFTVLRIWGFADGPGTGMGANAFQPAPGVYNETALRALDYVLHKADLAGVRLIIPLVNGNPEFGGVPQYLQWCGGTSERAFYEAPACKALYKNYVAHLLTRVNTYNGRPYRNDPTVFAWQLANEPNIQQYAEPTGQVMRAWVAEMAAHVKSLDPNHLLSTGEVGYDTTTAGYSSVSSYNNQAWLFDGNKGLSFTANTADPNIDFASIHLYTEYWNLSAAHGSAWIADHVRIARSLGKPLVIGEFGESSNPQGAFGGWIQTFEAENGGGALAWQVMCGICLGMGDQFRIQHPSAAADVLAAAASRANGRSGAGVPAPPAAPPPPPPAPPAPLPPVGAAAPVNPRLPAVDYDGDGRADIAVYRQATGEWFVQHSSDGRLIQLPWGSPALGDVPVPADFDGDGRADIAVYRAGQWFILRSADGGLLQVNWGGGGDAAVPSDYDGDGRADLAVYRPATGQWFILASATGQVLQVPWGSGALGDLPVPADYDGDHRADIAVYRTTTAEWFIRYSSDGRLVHLPWGSPALGDVPVPADYDGDGRVDIAVYRAGQWFVLLSSNGSLLQVNWGGGGDTPLPGRYGPDGRADLAVYRPSTGQWFILGSDGQTMQLSWGNPAFADVPRP